MFFVNLDYGMSKIYPNPVRSTGHMLVHLILVLNLKKTGQRMVLPPVDLLLVQMP